MRLVQYRKTLSDIAIGIGMGLFGFLAARLHVHVFDRLYLHLGKQTEEPASTTSSSSDE